MSTSWTNSSVSIHTIPRNSSVPILNSQTLWPGPDGSSFYPWGGEQSYVATTIQPPPIQLWKFTAHGITGFWSNIQASSKEFESLHRAVRGAGTVSGDIAYFFGGVGTQRSDYTFSKSGQETPLPGVISFNFTSSVWSNESTIGFNTAGTSAWEKTLSITALGSDDRTVLVVLGGCDLGIIPQLYTTETTLTNFVPFSNITMYDPYIGVWFAQEATGQIPPPRAEFCAVVVKGDDNTYEM
jgi:hypothetical protein